MHYCNILSLLYIPELTHLYPAVWIVLNSNQDGFGVLDVFLQYREWTIMDLIEHTWRANTIFRAGNLESRELFAHRVLGDASIELNQGRSKANVWWHVSKFTHVLYFVFDTNH